MTKTPGKKKTAIHTGEKRLVDSTLISRSEYSRSTKGTLVSGFEGPVELGPHTLPLVVSFEVPKSAEREDSYPQVKLVEKFAEGGMGEIFLGEQRALYREVVIKKSKQTADEDLYLLLREAWITGSLEHPNIIPVYLLGLDENKNPVMVMKKISGAPWNEVMFSPSHPLRKNRKESELDWNIKILLQLCNALRFSHAKGFIHRDLKPDNVMIGEFGEVYLLDWGIAHNIHQGEETETPLQWLDNLSSKIVGTPNYMAPEMLFEDSSLQDERTDVYLLGSLLHLMLTKTPKHPGSKLSEMVSSIVTSAPFTYDASVPSFLANLANKACHKNPDERYQSVEEFQQALESYFSLQLAFTFLDDAKKQVQVLKQMIEEKQVEEEKVHNFYTLAQISLSKAKEALAEKDTAVVEDELIRARFQIEVLRDNYNEAKFFFHKLDATEDDKTVLQKLAWQEQERNRSVLEFEELKKARDLSVGKISRLVPFASVMICFVIYFNFQHSHSLKPTYFTGSTFYSSILMMACLLYFFYIKRKGQDNAINRSFIASFFLHSIAMLFFSFLASKMKIDVRWMPVFYSFLVAVAFGFMGIFVDHFFFLIASTFLASTVLRLYFYQYHFLIAGASNVIAVLLFAFWSFQMKTDKPRVMR